MENVITLAVVDKLNHSPANKDNCIILRTADLGFGDFNFFELYKLYITLLTEGYELRYMEEHTIKVKKTQEVKDTKKVIYFP
jgi:hypothetical protein